MKVGTPGHKGGIAETAIAAHAVRLGIDVYRPVVDGTRCDLIFQWEDASLCRVQCKWGRPAPGKIIVPARTSRLTPAGYVRTTYDETQIDAFVVYFQPLDECYYLPIEEFAGLASPHLRLLPAKNNQRSGVKMAADYRLGAVAQLGERRAGSAKVRGSSPLSSTPPKAA